MLLFLPLAGNSQARNNVLRFSHFGVNEGLSQGNVTCMMQDHMGLMWIGTWDGLNVYDGFRNFSFGDPKYESDKTRGVLIYNILELDSNFVAIGTHAGLSLFDRSKQKFLFFRVQQNDSNTRLIKKDGNNLIVTINHKLFQFDLISFAFTPSPVTPGLLWDELMLKRKNGVNRSEFLFGRMYEVMLESETLFNQLKTLSALYTVNDLIFVRDLQKVFLACDEGLLEVDINSGTVISQPLSGSAKCLAILNEKLYVGTQDQGLIILDTGTKKISDQYTYDELSRRSVTGNFIRTLYIDRDENLWLSILGSGINYSSLKPRIASTYFSYSDLSKDEKSDNYIKALCETQEGILWTASITGRIRLLDRHNHVLSIILPEDIDRSARPNSIQKIYLSPRNEVYLLTERGLYKHVSGKKFLKAGDSGLSESQQYLHSMLHLGNNQFLLGTRKGLLIYHADQNVLVAVDMETLNDRTINYLFKDSSGKIYINSLFDELWIGEQVNGKLRNIKSIDLDVNLKDCIQRADTLIFASTKGLVIMNNNSYDYQLINEVSGLPNQNIYCVLPDKYNQNAVWCSSNDGIFRYNLSNGNLFTLGLNDGLSSLEFNSNAFADRSCGAFAFGSIDGLTVFDSATIPKSQKSNPLVHYNLNFDNSTAEILNQFSTNKHYELPYAQNGFSLRLIQVNFPNYEVPVRYTLSGHNNGWIMAKNPVDIRYANLREGNYEFMAEYYDRENGWIGGTLFTLEVKAPWERSKPAYLFYLLSCVLILAGANRFYLNMKLRRERELLERKELLLAERERISADLHDDVGSTLSSIVIYSDVIKHSVNQSSKEKTLSLASEIGDQARLTIETLSDIVWSLNPENDTGEKLISRMKTFASVILSSKNIAFTFDFDPEISDKEFSVGVRQNVYLIFKECINNLIKHSGATKASIRITREDSLYRLWIIDNGNSSSKVETSSTSALGGNGLRNLAKRAASIGGRFEIQFSETGTTAGLEFPES